MINNFLREKNSFVFESVEKGKIKGRYTIFGKNPDKIWEFNNNNSYIIKNNKRIKLKEKPENLIEKIIENYDGYNKDELLTMNRESVIHRDMPNDVLQELSSTLTQGFSWQGVLRMQAKNKQELWLNAFVTPQYENGKIIVYNSGTGSVRDEEELETCIGNIPGDNRTALFRIDVIEIPIDDPSQAKIVSSPTVFADQETGSLAGLWRGGDHGDDTQDTNRTDQCHDITVFPSLNIAAGACSGNGILFDITDPYNPKRLDVVTDVGFAYWHSATFNNDGTKVIFTDEWGGGGRARCRAWDPLDWGANAIYDIVDNKLEFRSHYKMPAPQLETENCVAHNGSLIPIPERDIFVQAWYQGGISVMDFTDSADPKEIASLVSYLCSDEAAFMTGATLNINGGQHYQ